MCQYPFKDLEILWILMQMQSFNLSNVSICSIEYILSCSLLLSGALLINHFFERLKYARVKNLSVHRIHTLKDYSKHGQTIYQFLWTMHKEFDKLECMQAQIYQSMKDTKILKYTLIIHAQAKNISVYQWRQSLDEPAHPCQSAPFLYWRRLWYMIRKAQISDVQELKDVNVGVISKVCRNCFFVPTRAKFVFVLACAEIALTFPISCAADISFWVIMEFKIR